MTVVIARDRPSSGGGIVNYYRAISPYLDCKVCFLDIGRPHGFYGLTRGGLLRFTPIRLLSEWTCLFLKILWYRPDLVHVNPSLDPDCEFRSMKRDAVSAAIALVLGRKLLVFWRGWDNHWCGKPEFPGGNRGWLARIYRKASAQIVLATRFKEDLRRWGFKMPIHVETTVASDNCLGSETETEADDGRISLLFLSRIEEGKGVFELIDAYRLLKARDPRYLLTFAGDGPHLEALKCHAGELGLEGVSFPGFVAGEAKVACYRSAAIFCFPSAYPEGMPNAVLEALAMGLPVVASDVGGLRDILQEGKTGAMLVQRGEVPRRCFDPAEMADVIESLANNPALRQRISLSNAAYARERFAAPVVARRLQAIYESVVCGADASQSEVRSTDLPSGGN